MSLIFGRTVQPYINGAVYVTLQAPVGNVGARFPGTSGSYFNFGASSPANFDLASSNLFVEAWVNTTVFQSTATSIIGRANTVASPAEDWMLWITGTAQARMRVTSSVNVSQDATLATTMTAGTWYHMAGSWDNTNKKIYVFLNGTASTATTFTGTPRYNSTWAIQAGIYTGGSGQYQNGYTRDIRIFQGGIVPTATFTPQAAPWASGSSPTYVTGATNVFGLAASYLQTIQLTRSPTIYNGQAGIAVAAPVSNVALSLPGTVGNYLNFGTNAVIFDLNTSNIFLEAWVYVNAYVNASTFACSNTSSSVTINKTFLFTIGSAAGNSNLGITVSNQSGGSAINNNLANGPALSTWTHIAYGIGFSGATLRWYMHVNGSVNTGTGTGPIYVDATQPFFVGGGTVGSSPNCYIRDLRVIKGSILPRTTFIPDAAPFSTSSVPTYTSGGTNVFTLAPYIQTGQMFV